MTRIRIAPAIFAVLPMAITVSMLVFGVPCAAAQDTTTITGSPNVVGPKHQLRTGFRTFEGFPFKGSMGRVVKDKPYTATAVTETAQTLSDGNRIVHTNQATFYRDSAGRTRREQSINTLGPAGPAVSKQIIVLSDPVADTEYVLDPADKTARKTRSFWRGRFMGPKEVSGVPMDESFGNSANVTKQDLGSQTIAGLQCTGTRITRTIPAGQIGNEKPIVSVKEVWYSAEIDGIVQSKSTDPRFGTTTYTLSEVKLGEQPQQLFTVPADYKVESMREARTYKRFKNPNSSNSAPATNQPQ